MLKSKPQGGLGNRLFQYVFARLLAQEMGYAFESPEIIGFPQLPISLSGTIEETEFILDDIAQRESIEDIADRLMGMRVTCCGYYEQSKFYEVERELISEWFQFGPGRKEKRTAIHVRGGDAAIENHCPPISYYQEAIKQSQFLDRCIVTDDPDNQVCLALARQFFIPVYCRNVMEDWEYIRNSAQVIIGNSTFSWWAAFLSAHDNVIQPLPWKGWRSLETPNKLLHMDSWYQIPY